MTTSQPLAPPRRLGRWQRGSTFAELMLASLIVGTTVVASTASLSESAEVHHAFADGPHEALSLAQEIHRAAGRLPWEAEPGALPGFGANVVTLWDLDGQSYSPPRSADDGIITSHPAWIQAVEIRTVDLHHPTDVVDEDFEGDTVTELVVTISAGDTEVDTFRWWMSKPTSESPGGSEWTSQESAP